MLWWLLHERGGMPFHDAVGVNCKNRATTQNKGSGVYLDDCVCVGECVCVCVCII